MTIRCGECGGEVRVKTTENGPLIFTHGEEIREIYECQSCGETGTHVSSVAGDKLTGCLVEV